MKIELCAVELAFGMNIHEDQCLVVYVVNLVEFLLLLVIFNLLLVILVSNLLVLVLILVNCCCKSL